MVIYVHIPFCIKKCDYCDFLSAPRNDRVKAEYVACLMRELEAYGTIYGSLGRNMAVTSVFLGGGTPSILEGEQIKTLLECIRTSYYIEENAEITMECNPGTLTKAKLLAYREAGINRLSIGLQSADDMELKSIGRIHTFDQFLWSYNMARECGFDNINIDLMSALPGQTIASYESTINKILRVQPEHISAYSLILEEGTPLYNRIEGLKDRGMPTGLPDEETEREMYYMTGRLLEAAGYKRYEISNYAREGYQCRHNTAYWRRDNYLGVGIGAASCMDNVRTKNIVDIGEYMQIYRAGRWEAVNAVEQSETDVLTREDMMAEFMFLGLRMIEGVSKHDFAKQFGVDYEDVYGQVTDKLIGQGLLEQSKDNQRLWLTPLGIDVSNMVLASFVAD